MDRPPDLLVLPAQDLNMLSTPDFAEDSHEQEADAEVN